MANLSITRSVVNGVVFTQAQNETQMSDIETFVNTTKLTGTDNIQTGSIITANIAANAITSSLLAASSVGTSAIADSAVTTPKILDSNVTTAKIADANVTTVKIADANVTAAKIETNVNLPGSGVQVNSKKVITSNTNATANLSVVRGVISSGGATLSGEGFSISRGGVGTYTVTFSTAFADKPALCVTTESAGYTTISSISASSFVLICWNFGSSLSPLDTNFHFIAIGQRA